uniref:RRM domain-containing protein n=1 Tax=Brassica oleracea var. oleracea TaxID=109376 RepID=A0A0D3A410_BRAOL
EFSKILFVANLSPQTATSDIIDFFKDVGQVVRVRLQLNARGKHVGYGFVEFASSNQAKMALERKNRQSLHCSKIILDEAPDFVEEAAVPIKTLFIASFPRYSTEISDIIDFFKDVGQVVRVRLEINDRGRFVGCGFVDFASANQANKALQNKNGEYLHDRKIFLADGSGATFIPPKFCVDHKVWYEEEDYLQEESLRLDSIQDVAAMEEGPDETPHSANKEVLLIANLSPQTTKTEQIIRFFEVVGSVVSVRLIVDHECKHVGYGFVEFDSSYEAEKALKELNGEYLHDHKILLMRGLDDETPHSVEEAATVRNKTLFVSGLSRQTKISEIVSFFKDVGEVVHVRLIVRRWGNLHGKGFVEFASANEAMKALEKKNGEYLNGSDVFLAYFQTPPYHRRPKYFIDHKVWYQDYLQRESLEIKEDVAAVEKGLDETPHFTEEIVRKKTVFVDGLSYNTRISDIINFFKDVREEIIRVRFIVDGTGDHVGCCFVEMATANAAKKAVQENYKTNKFFVYAAEIAAPCPFQPKYKLADLAEKLWYEDSLRQKSLCGQKLKPILNENKEAAVPVRTLFIASLSRHSTEISDIIDFFKDVGQVVRVRLEINDRGKFVGCGFVDFASANQANKALQNKNGEYLHDRKIFLADGSGATFIPPKFCVDHKVWYEEEDYLQEESLRLDSIQDVAAMEEGPDETPHSANKVLIV